LRSAGTGSEEISSRSHIVCTGTSGLDQTPSEQSGAPSEQPGVESEKSGVASEQSGVGQA